jgi:acetyl esterase/lipase
MSKQKYVTIAVCLLAGWLSCDAVGVAGDQATGKIVGLGSAEESGTARPIDHSRLLTCSMPDGQQRPVRTAEDWAIRRRQILAGMELAMGKLPDRSKLPPLDVKVAKRVEGDGFIRLEISYLAEANDRVPAFLYLPKGRPAGRRLPAMLALHPTSTLGKRRVAGEGSDTASLNRAYAKELAQRGYVVLAPDYPSFGDYPYDFHKNKYLSGSMKGVFNHMRGVDLLLTREEVDPERIGAIGHSLGAHNAMFLGVFDQRIKVIVSSCGWTPSHDYMGGKLGPWAQDCYMPRIRDVYGNDPDRVPFDFYEVVAALAPRAFFSSSPLRDQNFDAGGVKKAETKAREVFALLGAVDRLKIVYPDCPHDFPPEARRAAYSFIDRIFRHTPSRDIP